MKATKDAERDEVQEEARRHWKVLAAHWVCDTEKFSSVSELEIHPCCAELIALGEASLPFIFEDLRQGEFPHHSFILLSKITKESPVREEHRGYTSLMASDWLRWGYEKGYL
jgi:hypothetical protein